MKITSNFKRAAKTLLAKRGNMTVVVTKTQKWNVQALVRMGDLKSLIELPDGTIIDSGSRGTFRKMEENEIKYQDLMRYAK